jgi:hypothetical protein
MHPLVSFRAGRFPVHIALGRVMATLLLCLLFWLSVRGDRKDAQRELATLSKESYASGFEKHRKKLKETAEQSDGFLIGMTTVLVLFVVAYEGAAWIIGAGLGYADTLGEGRPPAPGEPPTLQP